MMLIGTWYGMNFVNMPELKHGYSYATAAMILSTALTWWYFKRKKWF